MDHEQPAKKGSGKDDKLAAAASAQWRGDEASVSISDSIARGGNAIEAAASAAVDSGRPSLGSVKDSAADFVAGAGGQAARSARSLASNVAGRVSEVAGDLADRGADAAAAATAQTKTFTAELEAIARRNPIGAIAGAVAIGALIGLLRRRR
jgi:ElaB/YqjD/DUF883 family membrane-anchored ribosome-binding protein